MDEKPKSFWKKSLNGPRGLLWLIPLTLGFAVIYADGHVPEPLENYLGLPIYALLFSIFITLTLLLAVKFVRWVCCWRNFKRFLLDVACLATLIALVYTEENWRGKHDWEKFQHEWEAKGEHFDYASIVPPPVPDDQNFALTPIVASSYEAMLDKSGHEIRPRNTNVINRLEMHIDDSSNGSPTNGYWAKGTKTDLTGWQQYYRTAAAKTNLFPIPTQLQTPSQDVLLALSKYDAAIEELRVASQLPDSRFPIEYDKDNPAEILLPHLAMLKSVTQTLRLRAIAELQNGQSEKALDDVKLMLYLGQSIRSEPVLISHLVRLAIFQIALQPIYEGLAEHQWSAAQLAALDVELAKFDFLADYEFSMRGERTFGISVVEYLRRSRNLQAMGFDGQGDPSSPPFSNLGFQLAPSAFFYRSELTMARMHQQWTLPMVDVESRIVSPQVVRQNQDSADAALKHGWPYNVMARMLFPAFENAVKKFAYAQSSLDMARVAVALERYRLAHGEYPQSLDALPPQFMEKIPHDIINGGALHYHRTSDGQFDLYSVGWNEKDDGGVVGLKEGKMPTVDINQGDWVWRYPAR
jgi:hypothetical protein